MHLSLHRFARHLVINYLAPSQPANKNLPIVKIASYHQSRDRVNPTASI